jgi:hypothetical protein
MEHAFHPRYREGNKMFYVAPTNWQGGVEIIDDYEMDWNSLWKFENASLKIFCNWTLIFKSSPIKCFFCGMETIACKHGFHILIGFIKMMMFNTFQRTQ